MPIQGPQSEWEGGMCVMCGCVCVCVCVCLWGLATEHFAFPLTLVLDAKLAVSTRCMMLLRPNEWAIGRRGDRGVMEVVPRGEVLLLGRLGVSGMSCFRFWADATVTRMTRRTLVSE